MKLIKIPFMVVVRTQRIKFSSLNRALEHRLKGIEKPPNVEIKELRDIFSEKLRKWETLEGKKNLRKNASLLEFVISYKGKVEKEKVLKDLERFLRILREKTDIDLEIEAKTFFGNETIYLNRNWIGFLHDKGENTHIHILVIPRQSNGKKVNLKPGIYKEVLKEFLPISDWLKIKNTKRKIGAYPLWVIRELEKRHGKEWTKEFISKCRKLRIPSPKLEFVVNRKREKELEEELNRLMRILEEEKRKRDIEPKRNHSRGLGL